MKGPPDSSRDSGVAGAALRRPGLVLPCLCLVTDRNRCRGRSLEETVAAAVEGGVTAVQLREPDLPARELYELALRLRPVLAGRALFFVNDRLDVALAAGADGVQLGGRSLPVPQARRIAGPGLLLGRSVHSFAEAAAAQADGADFIILGTIFPTASHPGVAGAGVELIRQVRATVVLPILAIGGIDPDNAAQVMEAGADGVAVISAILAAEDPRSAAAAMLATMQKAALPLRPVTDSISTDTV